MNKAFSQQSDNAQGPVSIPDVSADTNLPRLFLNYWNTRNNSRFGGTCGGHALYRIMGDAANQQTILVVEDDAIIRMSSVVTLQDAGFRVLEAKNSADALCMMALHGEIEVLLTDVRMPGCMDGLALVARTHKDYPAIRSIVVSGNASAEQACDAGASGFVAKPYQPLTIVRAIHDTVLRYQA